MTEKLSERVRNAPLTMNTGPYHGQAWFNQVADEIADLERRLEEMTEKAFAANLEKMHAADDLLDARQRLEALNSHQPSLLYTVVRKGVYRHEILASCTDIDVAKALARAAVKEEPDSYHSILIIENPANALVKDGTEITHLQKSNQES